MTTTTHRPVTEIKSDLNKQFTLLREVCSKASNWSAIQPILDRFDGSLQTAFSEFETRD